MRTLNVEQMEKTYGGSNRQCLIDGMLTDVATGLGAFFGGIFGAATGILTGLYAANSDGCFG